MKLFLDMQMEPRKGTYKISIKEVVKSNFVVEIDCKTSSTEKYCIIVEQASKQNGDENNYKLQTF